MNVPENQDGLTTLNASASTSLPFRYPHSPVYAVGTGNAWIFPIALPVENVREMLPDCLEPMPRADATPGRHPVLVMMVHHRGVRPNVLPFGGMDYLEFLVAIPDLRWRSSRPAYRGPFVTMPRLFLDECLPVFLGWLYAFPKLRERLGRDDRSFQVRHLLSGRPIVSGRVELAGEPGSVADLPDFGRIASMLRQPFAQRLIGSFCLCSYLDFQFAEARARPLAGRLDFQEGFLPGLEPGLVGSNIPGFEIQVPWTLAAPFLARQIRPVLLS